MRTSKSLLPLVIGLAAPTLADFTYTDFSSTAGLTLVGAAHSSNGSLRLCPSVGNLSGAAWYDTRQDVVAPFTTELVFRLETDGDEGLVFVIQRDQPAALGGVGQLLGYDGIANSLAIELDTHQDLGVGDPSGNHLSVHSLGAGPNSSNESASLASTSLVAQLNDGLPHTLRVEYVPGALRVFVDDLVRPALQVDVDLDALLDLDDGTAWVGFTAATGAFWQNHWVDSWSFDEQATVWTGNHAPDAPTIVEPQTDGEILNPFDVHMETSTLVDADGDGHAASDFEIWTMLPAERAWIGHGLTGLESLHAHLGDGVFVGDHQGLTALKEQEAYVVRMRHRDDSGDAWSDFGPWSERCFQTGAAGDFFPLEADDLRSTPAPVWIEAGNGAPFVLPPGSPQPGVYLESAAGDLLLSLEGLDGAANTVTNPPGLDEHVPVRVRIESGSLFLNLPETDLTVVDDECRTYVLLLPSVFLPPGQAAYLWVTTDGGTWWGDATQTEPDFSNQARSASLPWVTTRGDLKVEVVAGGFELPVNIAFVPNPGGGAGDPLLYVSELYGQIRVVTQDGTVGDYATGLLNYNPTGNFPGSGEQGVTGLAVDPLTGDVFASMLYDAGGPHYPKVVRFTSADGGLTAATQTTILDMAGESQGQSHQVSHVEFHPDGSLIVHMGDGFNAGTAQNLDSYRGKILRMNPDGSPTTNNPFYDAGNGINARDYVYAYGVRNPFGGAWRDSDGFHYEVENGPSVDRMARVHPGQNFGWDGTNQSMFTGALYNWVPSHGPVELAVLQPGTFGGSGFPAGYMDRMYVSESGPTYAPGPQVLGKRVVEYVVDAAGDLVSGPDTVVEYVGTGRSTAVGLAAGPDGLYFTELYAEQGGNPTASGARLLRLSFTGAGGCGALGDDYCVPAVANSTGKPAELTVLGSDQVADAELTLEAEQLPLNQSGYFIASLTQGFVANPGGSQGNLCLGGAIGRFTAQIQNSGQDGHFSIPVDVANLPPPLGSIQPGETWSFQAWYRDLDPNPTSNFTQGVAVRFQ